MRYVFSLQTGAGLVTISLSEKLDSLIPKGGHSKTYATKVTTHYLQEKLLGDGRF